MTVISAHEKKRLERKLDLFLTLLETADRAEREFLLRDIIGVEQQLGIKSKREVRRMKKEHLPFTTEQILNDLKEGLSQTEVAEKYRLSESYVSKIKQKHIGVRYEVVNDYERLTPPVLANLLNEGYTLVEIANSYKMSVRGVSLIRDKYIEKQFYLKEG